MSDATWSAVDDYLEGLLTPPEPGLSNALQAATEAGLPAIQVTALQGKMLHLLVHITGAKRVLEVGTLGGYSAIWLARALPDGGEVVTLEIDPVHARVAAENFVAAGVADRVRLILGPALESLPTLEQEASDPFDLAFIDADKVSNSSYVEWAINSAGQGPSSSSTTSYAPAPSPTPRAPMMRSSAHVRCWSSWRNIRALKRRRSRRSVARATTASLSRLSASRPYAAS